jgi:hypothetical protein
MRSGSNKELSEKEIDFLKQGEINTH